MHEENVKFVQHSGQITSVDKATWETKS